MQKICTKIPDPCFILVNNPKQPLHARNYFKNKIFWKRIIKKLIITLKKLTLVFLSNPAPFNRQSYEKQKGPGTSGTKRVHKNFFISYILSEEV